ncbi:hypothetical protein Cni_G19846 [Canna indica]|uniref:MULE transposase domain-containing protein n=1 Tax=Canna indica TaxID=4628 RepID=A0AAQ3QK55_9LILI|nr:hypothetical protein Cni_G19846 [Canna indica]
MDNNQHKLEQEGMVTRPISKEWNYSSIMNNTNNHEVHHIDSSCYSIDDDLIPEEVLSFVVPDTTVTSKLTTQQTANVVQSVVTVVLPIDLNNSPNFYDGLYDWIEEELHIDFTPDEEHINFTADDLREEKDYGLEQTLYEERVEDTQSPEGDETRITNLNSFDHDETESTKLYLHQGMFTVVNFVNNHTCTVSRLNLDYKECSAKFIVNQIKDQLVGNQKYTPAMIITEIQKSFGVRVSYKKAYNALHIALVSVRGEFAESYKDLPSYLRELRIHDHATAIDSKSGLFPIAFAVCDIERRESWEWFLEEFVNCVPEFRSFSIMSDRNLSILAVIRIVFLEAHHGYCMVHLAKNLVHDDRSRTGAGFFWGAARATSLHTFNECMLKM